MTGTSLVTIRRGSPVMHIVARFVASLFPHPHDAYASLDQLEGGVVEVV